MASTTTHINDGSVGLEARSSAGTQQRGEHERVYFVPLDVDTMRRIRRMYTREGLVTAANALKSYKTFGENFSLKFAGELEIEPTDGYDFREVVKHMLDEARRWRDMFGFVAYYSRNVESMRHAILSTYDSVKALRRNQATAVSRGAGPEATEEELQRRVVVERARMYQERIERALRGGGGDNADVDVPLESLRELVTPRVAAAALARDKSRGVSYMGQTLARLSNIKAPELGGLLADDARNGGSNTADADARLLATLSQMQPLCPSTSNAAAAGDDAPKKRKRTADAADDYDAVLNSANRVGTANMIISLENVRIVPFDSGQFFVRVDPLTLANELVWCATPDVPDDKAYQRAYHAASGTARFHDLPYNPNVHVYVWPGRMPTERGEVISDFVRLSHDAERLDTLMEINTRAAYHAAFPTYLIEEVPDNSTFNPEDATEEEIEGSALFQALAQSDNIADMALSDRRKYIRSARNARLAEAAVDAYNTRLAQRREDALRVAERNAVSSTLAHTAAEPERYAFSLGSESLLPLPPQTRVSHAMTSAIVLRENELRSAYELLLTTSLGVPLTFLRGAGTMSNRSDGTTAMTDSPASGVLEEQMNATIKRDREELTAFFESMYATLYTADEDEYMKAGMRRINTERTAVQQAALDAIASEHRQLKQATAAAVALSVYGTNGGGGVGGASTDTVHRSQRVTELLADYAERLRRVENTIARILSMPRRMRIEFKTNLIVSPEVYESLLESCAITPLEFANIKRRMVGKGELSEAEFKANMEARAEYESYFAERESEQQADAAAATAKAVQPFQPKPAAAAPAKPAASKSKN